MSDIVEFDANGKAIRYLRSIHEIPYLNDPNIIVGSLTVPVVPMKYWKRVGNAVVEMTVAEKAVVDAAEAVLVQATERTRIENLQLTGKELAQLIIAKTAITKDQIIAVVKALYGL